MSDQATVTDGAVTESTEAQALEQQPETKPTETVDFWKAKAREQEKRAKENAAAATRLSELEAANLSESERATRRIADLEAELSKAQGAAVRRSVALAKGLPAELVDRLQGDSEAEIEADADALLAVLALRAPQSGTPRPDPSQGARNGTATQLNSDGLEGALRSKLGIR
jgi:hypothetical protein